MPERRCRHLPRFGAPGLGGVAAGSAPLASTDLVSGTLCMEHQTVWSDKMIKVDLRETSNAMALGS